MNVGSTTGCFQIGKLMKVVCLFVCLFFSCNLRETITFGDVELWCRRQDDKTHWHVFQFPGTFEGENGKVKLKSIIWNISICWRLHLLLRNESISDLPAFVGWQMLWNLRMESAVFEICSRYKSAWMWVSIQCFAVFFFYLALLLLCACSAVVSGLTPNSSQVPQDAKFTPSNGPDVVGTDHENTPRWPLVWNGSTFSN